MTIVRRTILQTGTTILSVLMFLCLTGCGGSKLLDDPEPVTIVQPLTTVSDQRLEAHLDWVIVRDGPGTWAKNANWDEYLLRVRNFSDEPIRITGVAILDSLDTRLESSANRKKLVKASRESVRRHGDEGLKVKAGVGGPTLIAVGSTAMIAAPAYGAAVLAGSVGAGAAGVAVGAVILAPVLIVGGMVQNKNNDWVAREMVKRHTALPADISPAEQQSLDIFFPLTPSPRKIELSYVDSSGEHKLIIDTRDILQDLHIDNTDQ